MKIVVDSREQLPLKFSHPFITGVIVKKLDVGDYAVVFEDGHTPPFFFDRKSIADLFGTMGNGYERFKKCIIRTHNQNAALFIIVEGALFDVLKGYEHSTIKGTTVVYKLFTLWIKHGVQTVFVNDRKEMSEYITQFFIAVGKRYVELRENGERPQDYHNSLGTGILFCNKGNDNNGVNSGDATA